MKNRQEALYICLNKKNVTNIAGSTLEKCADCDDEIWVAPSAKNLRSEYQPVRTICEECFYKRNLRMEDMTIPKLSAEQRAELKKIL